MKKYWVGALLILAMISMIASNVFEPRVIAKAAPVVGSTAPEFSLKDLDGKEVQLGQVINSHRLTIVNFWATWCPPCRAEIPDFIEFYQEYSSEKVALLAVNLQENPTDVKQFAAQNGMNFSVLTDTTGKVGNAYQIYAIPTTFFIDETGKIRHKIEGATRLANLKAQVNALLKE